jgi:hypothetical protein
VKRRFKIMRISPNKKVIIGVDSLTMKDITSYIGQDPRHKGKFIDIANVVLEEKHNRHLYKREKISDKIKNVTAMRFFVGQENDRIYCQELSYKDKKIVVLGVLHLHKTSDEITEQERGIIAELSKYIYEIEDDQKHHLDE